MKILYYNMVTETMNDMNDINDNGSYILNNDEINYYIENFSENYNFIEWFFNNNFNNSNKIDIKNIQREYAEYIKYFEDLKISNEYYSDNNDTTIIDNHYYDEYCIDI